MLERADEEGRIVCLLTMTGGHLRGADVGTVMPQPHRCNWKRLETSLPHAVLEWNRTILSCVRAQ